MLEKNENTNHYCRINQIFAKDKTQLDNAPITLANDVFQKLEALAGVKFLETCVEPSVKNRGRHNCVTSDRPPKVSGLTKLMFANFRKFLP